MTQKIKIMIVDDHPVIREGLRQLLEIDDDIEVVAEASSGLECLQLLERYCPDIVFMDVKMPGINGIETTRLVCQKYPQIKVIMLTIYGEDQYVTKAIQVGAKGYVLKKVNRNELIKIIHHVMGGEAFLDSTLAATVFDHLRKDKKTFKETAKAGLTQRELEILGDIVAGLTDHKIAESLYISKHTVRSHIKSLYRKLGVSSRSQAVAKAMKERIINNDN